MKKATLIIALSSCFWGANAQDTIWLKSGQTLSGYILSFTDGFTDNSVVTIEVKSDTLVYKLNEIKLLRYNGGYAGMGKSKNGFPVYAEDKDDKSRKKKIAAKPPVKTEQ